MFRSSEVVRGRRVLRDRPLFPGYLFVRLSPYWREVASTRGVRSLIMAGEEPGLVSDSEIDRFASMTDADGYVLLPERPDISKFKRGQKVLASNGAFRGHEGLYQGLGPHCRVQVLLAMLGRKVRVAMDESDLVAA
jgi:transcriptional antiterminator RfaH